MGRARGWRVLPLLFGVLALPAAAGAEVGAVAPGVMPDALVPGRAPASASLESCVAAPSLTSRSATFVAEMSTVPGTARMEMRIDLLERLPHELAFRAIPFAGQGQWLHANPGVHTFKNFDRVAGLAGPADYRAAVRFRWLSSRGRVIRSLEVRTPRCDEPASQEPTAAAQTATP